MIGTAEQEAHAAYFAVMIDDTLKFPVKLPGNDACRIFKAESLVKQKGQQGIGREIIFGAVNGNGLAFSGVPCNGKILIEPVSGKKQAVKTRFFFK